MLMTKLPNASDMLAVSAALVLSLSASRVSAQPAGPTTHTIFMTAVELKGATTTDKLPPPGVNPEGSSKGYEFKAPGAADKANPKKWQVSSYLFSPSFITVRQGDTVALKVFVVNGNEHDISVTDPDGRVVVAKTIWNRGREHSLSFTQRSQALTT